MSVLPAVLLYPLCHESMFVYRVQKDPVVGSIANKELYYI
jgi:hypothetical protein